MLRMMSKKQSKCSCRHSQGRLVDVRTFTSRTARLWNLPAINGQPFELIGSLRASIGFLGSVPVHDVIYYSASSFADGRHDWAVLAIPSRRLACVGPMERVLGKNTESLCPFSAAKKIEPRTHGMGETCPVVNVMYARLYHWGGD